jgi:hypothetical protein
MRASLMILLLAGLFSEASLAADAPVVVRLEAQSNSGQHGTATLHAEGDMTRVVVELSNVPAGTAQPAHIHRGSCDKLDKAPRWNLKAVTDGGSVTLVPAPLHAILAEPVAINIHKSALETQVYVACGNIAGKR